jgi:hypothetical protein
MAGVYNGQGGSNLINPNNTPILLFNLANRRVFFAIVGPNFHELRLRRCWAMNPNNMYDGFTFVPQDSTPSPSRTDLLYATFVFMINFHSAPNAVPAPDAGVIAPIVVVPDGNNNLDVRGDGNAGFQDGNPAPNGHNIHNVDGVHDVDGDPGVDDIPHVDGGSVVDGSSGVVIDDAPDVDDSSPDVPHEPDDPGTSNS